MVPSRELSENLVDIFYRKLFAEKELAGDGGGDIL